jgi:maleate isomerase
VLGYACLVAIMSMGQGYHRRSQQRLQDVTARESGAAIPVVTSAGALVDSLQVMQAKNVAIIAPYMKALTCMVAEYIEAEGIRVVDRIALEIPDNVAVGRRDPLALTRIYKDLKLDGVDVLVLSSCVQMPSLAAVPLVESECGLPVISASIATTYQMLGALGLRRIVPGAGALLSGRFAAPSTM